MDKIKVFLNKILFEQKLEKVKKDSLRSYLKDFFLYKNLIFKLITLIFCFIVCAPLFFCIRNNVLNGSVEPVMNSGAGFSTGENWNQGVVYFIKILIGVLFLSLGIFFNRWYVYIPALIIGFNGWLNVIDKAIVDVWNGESHYNTVVDYIHLAEGSKIASVANVADVFITIGICLLVLGIIYYMFALSKENKQAEENKTNNEDNKEETKA